MQESQKKPNELLEEIKEIWHHFLKDRDFDALKRATEKFTSIQTPIEEKECEGWLWFTRAAVARLTIGLAEWEGMALLAAECGNVMAMDSLATAYLYKGGPDEDGSNEYILNHKITKEEIRTYVRTVFDSPIRPGARMLANNVICSKNFNCFQGLFDEQTLKDADKILSETTEICWRIGSLKIFPTSISRNKLLKIRDVLIAAWTFNLTSTGEQEYRSVIQLSKFDSYLIVYVKNGNFSIKKKSEFGSHLVCDWNRKDLGPIHLIYDIISWIESTPFKVWPQMHLALSGSVDKDAADTMDASELIDELFSSLQQIDKHHIKN